MLSGIKPLSITKRKAKEIARLKYSGVQSKLDLTPLNCLLEIGGPFERPTMR